MPMDVKTYDTAFVNLSDGSLLGMNYGITVRYINGSDFTFHSGIFRSCVLWEYIDQLELVALPQLPGSVDSVCIIGVHECVFINHNIFFNN